MQLIKSRHKIKVIVIDGLDRGALLLCLVGMKWEAVCIHSDYQNTVCLMSYLQDVRTALLLGFGLISKTNRSYYFIYSKYSVPVWLLLSRP